VLCAEHRKSELGIIIHSLQQKHHPKETELPALLQLTVLAPRVAFGVSLISFSFFFSPFRLLRSGL